MDNSKRIAELEAERLRLLVDYDEMIEDDYDWPADAVPAMRRITARLSEIDSELQKIKKKEGLI